MWPRARLLFHTLLYLKPWQVFGRIWASLKRKAGPPRLPQVPAKLEVAWNKRVSFHGHDPWNSREDIINGRFCFLNEATDLDLDTDWRASQMPLLWQFNLHYFHFLYLLERKEQEATMSFMDSGQSSGHCCGLASLSNSTSHCELVSRRNGHARNSG